MLHPGQGFPHWGAGGPPARGLHPGQGFPHWGAGGPPARGCTQARGCRPGVPVLGRGRPARKGVAPSQGFPLRGNAGEPPALRGAFSRFLLTTLLAPKRRTPRPRIGARAARPQEGCTQARGFRIGARAARPQRGCTQPRVPAARECRRAACAPGGIQPVFLNDSSSPRKAHTSSSRWRVSW
ncbi:hypothetical protein C7I36_04295 [Zobellella taiwanensis]|uniref:Uncharacterized protein n=1 Tax=Zobellella taiwanensis TaxID=347535 RepID=A0A2P7R6U3_9GAMM|nr:hypothetical protein C7I36_04295 [Zobellella taiwanensis]